MLFKKLAASAALALSAWGLSSPAHAVIQTDIIMIVDESGSMGTVQANLRNNIGLFASILSGGGVDAQYGLVGYGNSAVKPRMVTNLTTAAGFATAAQGLVASGGTEPAYIASAFALNALDNQSSLFNFRTNAVKNIIIFTDEPANGDYWTGYGAVNGAAVTFSTVDGLLTDNKALYNAVLSGSNTIASIGGLADNHNGSVFNLASLNTTDQSVVESFVTAFATAKLQETIDFCVANPNDPACQNVVPEPGVLALLGLGVLGVGVARRRRNA